MKKIINYFILTIPWFIFIFLIYYFKSLHLIYFILLLIIGLVNILISYTIINIFFITGIYYKVVLFLYFVINQLFLLNLFYGSNRMLLFTNSIFQFVSSLYLYEATYAVDSKIAKYLIPNILFTLFFSFYMLILIFVYA